MKGESQNALHTAVLDLGRFLSLLQPRGSGACKPRCLGKEAHLVRASPRVGILDVRAGEKFQVLNSMGD